MIKYGTDLIHPWPREFRFSTEFFTETSDPQEVRGAIKRFFGLDRDEHVLNVLCPYDSKAIEEYVRLGYREAWTNELMIRDVPSIDPPSRSKAHFIEVKTDVDLHAMNALNPEDTYHAPALLDPHLHFIVAKQEGQVVARGQIVTLPDSYAYISDMYAAPLCRRKGLGTALLWKLHAKARENRATKIVLVPSEMTRKFKFYERNGYSKFVDMSIMIP